MDVQQEAFTYPSAREDATAGSDADVEARKPTSDTLSGSSMVSVTPAITAATENRHIVPCTSSGEKTGTAAGAFLNDAQIAHAALLGNTIDSAVSAAALTRTQNPAVRAYAEMMIRDHTAANQRVTTALDLGRIAPAENDVSTDMLRDVTRLATATPASGKGGTVATEPKAPSTTAAPYVVTTPSTATTSVPVARDTLHLGNPWVASMNMQPWSTLLSGLGTDSVHVTVSAVGGPEAKPATQTAAVPMTVPTEFDRQYMDYQVQFHQKTLDALDTRLIPWAGSSLRAVLQAARPTVVAHLEQGPAVAAGVPVSGVVLTC